MSALSESSCPSRYNTMTNLDANGITSRTTQGNPLSEVEEYRVEVCILLRQLERLDKDEFTEDERADAEEVSKLILLQQKSILYTFDECKMCRYPNSVNQSWNKKVK